MASIWILIVSTSCLVHVSFCAPRSVDESGPPDVGGTDDFYEYYYEDKADDGHSPSEHHEHHENSRSRNTVHNHMNHNFRIPPRLREIESLLNPSRYDRYHAASWEEDKPVEIWVGMYIESLSAFHSRDNSFDADLYLRKLWHDDRLKHRAVRHVTLNEPHLIQGVWKPDLYFANAKQTSINSVTKPNQMLKVFPDGAIQHSLKISAKIVCHLELHAYPVDSQECSIKVLSYAHPIDELKLYWMDAEPLKYNPDIALPEMNIKKLDHLICNGTYSNDTFSCLEARILVKRNIAAHLIQSYLPSMLIVGISWISFWIDPHAVPARITLCFTTLLTLTTQAAGMRTALPPVSYIKAIDFWMGFCTLMVLGAMAEYTYVNSLLQQAQQSHLRQKAAKRKKIEEVLLHSNSADGTANNSVAHPESGSRPLSLLTQKEYTVQAYRWDERARCFFPLLFGIFNIIYWSVLLTR